MPQSSKKVSGPFTRTTKKWKFQWVRKGHAEARLTIRSTEHSDASDGYDIFKLIKAV